MANAFQNFLQGREAYRNEQTNALNQRLGQQSYEAQQLALEKQRAEAQNGPQQSLEVLGHVAQQILADPNPDNRRARVKQVIGAPTFGSVFHSLGFDPAQMNVDGMDDNALQAELQQLAAYGPAEKATPSEELVQTLGPDGKARLTPRSQAAGMEPYSEEKFGAPQDIVYQGKPAVAQIGSRGTVRPVPGATPYNKPSAIAPAEAIPEGELDLAVTDVMADPTHMRQYASFGQAGQAKRDQINQGIADKLKAAGMTPADLIRSRANAKGQFTSIGKLTVQKNALDTFEGLAKANGQRALDLIQQVDATGIPIIERRKRLVDRALGDPNAAELLSVLRTFQTEASRIISNPDMKGVVSDSARHEIQDIAPDSMTAEQAQRVINRLFTEFDIRRSLIEQTLSNASNQLVPGQAPPPPAAPTAAGTQPQTSADPELDALLNKYAPK